MEYGLDSFLRLPDIVPEAKLWSKKDEISTMDISQGFTLGNCYVVAALSSLANKPELVKNIFKPND